MVARRFEVYLVDLEPTVGYEMRKTRPCVIISPAEVNQTLHTVIIAPLSTKSRPFPTRVASRFQGKSGLIVLDQLRSVDSIRLVRKLGQIGPDTGSKILKVLKGLFSE